MAPEPQLTRQELLDLLIAHLSDFVVVLMNEEGYFATWHPGVMQVFGYTADEFIGQTFELLLPLQERLRGVARRELEQAADTGRASDTRWLVKKNGQRVLVEGVTLGLRQSGELVGFGKILRDVTEHKNAEESLQALTEALDEATVLVRRWDGTIDHWTAGCERLYGWTAMEAVGHVCHELLRTVFPAPLERIQEQFLQSGVWQGVVEHIRRNGTRLWVATHWALLSGSDNEPPSVIETQTDITYRFEMQRELERANEQLKRMASELERSNEELEDFARIASHDLSAPITSTRWLVDVLASRHASGLDEKGLKCLQQITQGLDRMSDLVDGVLAHAQVGKSTIGSNEPVDAGAALAAALENLRRDIETSEAKVEFGTLPAVAIDAQALSQLFQNLLSNAIKYRRSDVRPLIKVTGEQRGNECLFAVEDNGMGIEAEWYERIFQPLQRLHGREISGSGIGLATCKKIVTRGGGRIWVESKVGEGSSFYFTVPVPMPQPDNAPRAGPEGGQR
ncbi:MAG: PAS domain S-box protein [Acidobacteriaceae bacterium]|nr:PAS domain S-box protein [Acidobacteriaceae bacterium]